MMAKTVQEWVSITADGMMMSDLIDLLKANLLIHGDQKIELSELSGSIYFGIDRLETKEEHLERMRRETLAWKQKVAKEDAARIRARNTLGVEAYREWERNRLPNVD